MSIFLHHEVGLNRSQGKPPLRPLGQLSARGRLLLLVFAWLLPMSALSTYVAFDQRAAAEERARAELAGRAELVAALASGFNLESLPRGGEIALGRGQMVTLVDPRGVVIGQYPSHFARPGERFPNPRVLESYARGEQVFDGADPSGVRRLYAVKKSVSGKEEVTVIVSMPAVLVYESIDAGLRFTLGSIGAVTIVLLFAAWYGAERLVLKPLGVLLEMTRRVRAGDLTARTGMKATNEELSQLGAALDAMAEQLETRERELTRALRESTEQAMTDPLTGLYNRRFFLDALKREIASSARTGVPFSVLMLDIDHFKRVNDTWGHAAGDEVLKAIAALLGRAIRGSDIAVRYGGEEFALLLPQTPLAVAAARAERLRCALEALTTTYGAERIAVTASFGVAQIGESAKDAPELMRKVDAAMYAAKQAGRNRVRICDPHSGAIGKPPA